MCPDSTGDVGSRGWCTCMRGGGLGRTGVGSWSVRSTSAGWRTPRSCGPRCGTIWTGITTWSMWRPSSWLATGRGGSGDPKTLAGRHYRFIRYGMKDVESGAIDYDALDEIARKEKPRIILAGFSSYPRTLDYKRIAEIARSVGALAMADMSHIRGLIAAGVLENPLDYGFHVIVTTTHKGLRGPRGALILSKGVVSSPLKAVERTIENIPTLIDRSVFPGVQGGPHMNAILAIAVALKEAASPEFRQYAEKVLENAQVLAKALLDAGCYLVTGGTDNHLMLVDVMRSFGVDGREAQQVLDGVGITVNANVIPDDPLPPYRPSGIRLGTPAVTTRGFDADDMKQLARWIVDGIKSRGDAGKLA